MGLFSFLSKKKEPAIEPVSPDMGVPMPTSNENPDIYADLPAFSEKSAGEELLPPLKPILHDASFAGIKEENPIPAPSNEDLPTPPDFNGFGEEEDLSPSGPYTIPSIQEETPAEAIQEAEVPALPEPPVAEPAQESVPDLPEPHEFEGKANIGPYIRAYELRELFKDVNDLSASIKLAQDVIEIKQILSADAAAYERFHKTIENLQRKLMLAEKMFMKV
jgi:hypothetical protein